MAGLSPARWKTTRASGLSGGAQPAGWLPEQTPAGSATVDFTIEPRAEAGTTASAAPTSGH